MPVRLPPAMEPDAVMNVSALNAMSKPGLRGRLQAKGIVQVTTRGMVGNPKMGSPHADEQVWSPTAETCGMTDCLSRNGLSSLRVVIHQLKSSLMLELTRRRSIYVRLDHAAAFNKGRTVWFDEICTQLINLLTGKAGQVWRGDGRASGGPCGLRCQKPAAGSVGDDGSALWYYQALGSILWTVRGEQLEGYWRAASVVKLVDR